MQCSLSLASIARRMSVLPRAARPWLGLTLGLTLMGCRFEPTSQGDIGPGPAGDAAAPLDARRPADAAAPPDAAPASPDAGEVPPFTLPTWLVEGDDIEIDGDLDDWGDDGWLEIAAPVGYVKNNNADDADAADLSIRFAARWHPDAGLYLAFEVTDEFHASDNGNTELLWRGDSVQAAFDVARNGGSTYDTTDDFEYGWALAGNAQAREHRWVASSGAPNPATQYQVVRSGTTTIYEIRMPPSNLALTTLEIGRRIGFSFAANEDDEDVDFVAETIRDGWLEWTPGIAAGPKLPGMFGLIELRGEADD